MALALFHGEFTQVNLLMAAATMAVLPVLVIYFSSTWPLQQLDTYVRTAELKPWTPHTITSPEQLRLELQRIQERGFAIDNEEHEEGVCCVGAPILDHTGSCIAAFSISGPSTRVTLESVYELGPRMRQAALECSKELGYLPGSTA